MGVIALGAGGQWLAWRLRLPSILVHLVLGFVVGPITGWIHPDQLLDDLVLPLVSLAAAVILFEGGLSASWEEIQQVARPVRRLVTVGLLLTWLLAAAAAYYLLEFSVSLSFLLGAILVVTGPTVIGPVLRHVRPHGRLGSVAKLEGIVNDPLGAVLAILVFQSVGANTNLDEAMTTIAFGVLKSAAVAGGIGLAFAWLLVQLLRRRLLPGFLRVSVAFAFVLLAFVAADALQPEAGLLAVTVMGVALASQEKVSVKPIVDFNENLRVVALPALFIVLAARTDVSAFQRLPGGIIAFGLAIFLIRPVVVWLSTVGTELSWQERVFLSWMAPRGVVAAAMSSVFALRLMETNIPNADVLMPVTFVVVIATVAIYGPTASPLASRLGLRQEHPTGFLVLGADRLARALASLLQDMQYEVMLVDESWQNVTQARLQGLSAERGMLVSERVLDRIDLDGLGRLLALSPNDEANTLASVHFRDVFDEDVYQLRAQDQQQIPAEYPLHLRGQYLPASHSELMERFQRGGQLKGTRLGSQFDFAAFREHYGDDALPLFAIDAQHDLKVVDLDGDENRLPQPGDTVISMVEGHRASDWPQPRADEEDDTGD